MMLGFFNQIRVEFGVPIPLDCLDGVLIVNKKPDRLGFRPQRGNIEVLEGCSEGMGSAAFFVPCPREIERYSGVACGSEGYVA